jgi:hypothetical protein
VTEYRLSHPYALGWHPPGWVLRVHGPSPDVLRGTKKSLHGWLRERRGVLPFYVHLIVRADFGPFDGSDYVLLLDRPEDHTAVLAGPDGSPVLIDLRPRRDPDDVAHRTRPSAEGRCALTVHSVQRRMIGETTWTEAHCYDPAGDRSDLVVYRSCDRLRRWTPVAYSWQDLDDYRRTGCLPASLRHVFAIGGDTENFLRDSVLLLLRRPDTATDLSHGPDGWCDCEHRH